MYKLVLNFLGFVSSLFQFGPTQEVSTPPEPTPIEVSQEASEEAQVNVQVSEEQPQQTVSTVSLLATPQPSPTSNPEPTVTPTPSPGTQLWEQCNQVSLPLLTFAGVSCLAKEESLDYLNDYTGKEYSQMDQIMVNHNHDDLKNQIRSYCYLADTQRFDQCNKSIGVNADRLYGQLLSQGQSELDSCFSELTVGENTIRERSQRYFVRQKLRDHMDELYNYCYAHGNSVDSFNF